MKNILLLLYLSGVGMVFGNQPCNFSEGVINIAELSAKGHFDDALSLSEELISCKQLTSPQIIELYTWQYKLYRNKLKRRNSREALAKADSIFSAKRIDRPLDFRLLLVESYALNGDSENYEKLIPSIERVVLDPAFNNPYFLGRYNLSKHYSMDGDKFPVERVTYIRKALEYFEESDSVPVYYPGNVLRALGNLNRSNGDFDMSAEFYKRELTLYREHYEPDHFNISICNYNLGGVYYEKLEYQLALDHFLAAHNIWKDVYKMDSFRMRSLNEAIGDMYWELNDHEKALEYFNYAVINEKEVNNDTSELTLSIADSLLATGDYSSALAYYKEAVRWRKQTYGEDHMLTGACQNFVARALQSSGDTEAALDAYQEAIMILVPEFKDGSSYANPDISMNAQSSQYLLEALIAKGELFKTLFRKKKNLQDLKAALSTQESAIALLEKIKNNQMSSASKIFWTTRTLELVESTIGTALLLQRQDPENKDLYTSKAFNFAERSKALLLLASLYDQEISAFANIPPEIIQKEKKLKQEINEYVGKIESEEKRCAAVRDKMLKLYTDKLHALQNEYDLHINQIEQNFPEYFHLKYDLQITDIPELQSELLQNGKLLISYFIGLKESYVFSISNKSASVRKLENTDRLKGKASYLFSLLNSSVPKSVSPQQLYLSYVQDAYYLYAELLQPELEKTQDVNQLIIIPDANLAYIPFEALLTEQVLTQKRDYRALPYVLKDFAVAYSPSASIAVFSKRGSSNNSAYFGFAPDYNSRKNAMWRTNQNVLLFNQPEVEFAADLFDGQKWTGKEVTEDILKSHADKAGILHMAMHGEVEDEHPLLSKLIFIPSDKEDGFLHTYEIYNLSIPAQLVILSACNTASGKLIRGEGILSLERAFQYAGSKALLATLWTVDDAASSAITSSFLEHIKAGKPKDIALQEAKLSFLESANPDQLHPFFWSSFKLTGNTAPLKRGIKSYYYGIILGILVMFAAIVFFRRQKTRKA